MGHGDRRGNGQGGRASTDVDFQVDDEQDVATCSFVDITQASPGVAKHYLEAYGWNVEAAVTGYLENGGQQQLQHRAGNGKEDRGQPRARRALAQTRKVVHADVDNEDSESGDGSVDDNSYEQLQTLASHRARRTAQPTDNNGRGSESEDDDDDNDNNDDPDYLQEEDVYGEEEDRFKYGRRSRRGHRRSMRRMERQQSRDAENQEDLDNGAHGIPQAVLNLPDINLEEQKMLMAAMTGQAYEGDIPDFSNYQSYVPKPLSPGAMARQMLRDEQDMAFEESLEMDRERQRQHELAQIQQMEREESARRENQILFDRLEEKKRRLPAEPAADDPAGLTLVIRLPSGARLKRRFFMADTMGSVFDYVDIEGGSELKAGGYCLVTNFPRKVLSSFEQAEASLKDLGFSTQEALFVEAT